MRAALAICAALLVLPHMRRRPQTPTGGSLTGSGASRFLVCLVRCVAQWLIAEWWMPGGMIGRSTMKQE